jgi:SAM-dependent methyltransferase
MGVSAGRQPDTRTPPDPPPSSAAIWHELECGAYRADLDLWLELADATMPAPGDAPILEVGAGCGRVALALARRGHRVTALELDPALLRELTRRAQEQGASVQAVCGDARELAIEPAGFALTIVAMQTVQLFGGPEERARFLAGARAHARPGGLIACAIVTELEQFSTGPDDPPAPAGRMWSHGRLYVSRATSVRAGPRSIAIERERRVYGPGGAAGAPTRETIELSPLSAAELEAEAAASGLQPLPRRSVPPTSDHVGSEVVVLRV